MDSFGKSVVNQLSGLKCSFGHGYPPCDKEAIRFVLCWYRGKCFPRGYCKEHLHTRGRTYASLEEAKTDAMIVEIMHG